MACRVAGLDSVGARMLRLGDHAVFRLADEPVIVRIGRSARYLEAARRELAVSAWLNSSGVPTARPASIDKEQPLIVDDRVVTFWWAAGDGNARGTTFELAALLRALHSLTSPAEIELPAFAPFVRPRRQVLDAENLEDADRSYLINRIDDLEDAYLQLRFALPVGPIHGDASVGNLLREGTGTPILIDLDGFSIGPREWDLIATATYYDRYGWHTVEDYDAFVGSYWFDIMTWEGYPVLCDVYETTMVAWMAQNVGNDDATADEFTKRMRAMRTGASRNDWIPF